MTSGHLHPRSSYVRDVPAAGAPPLSRAQEIGETGTAGLAGRVNTVYVTAASAADIPAVQRETAAPAQLTARDRAQLVVLAFQTGLVIPQTAARGS